MKNHPTLIALTIVNLALLLFTLPEESSGLLVAGPTNTKDTTGAEGVER